MVKKWLNWLQIDYIWHKIGKLTNSIPLNWLKMYKIDRKLILLALKIGQKMAKLAAN